MLGFSYYVVKCGCFLFGQGARLPVLGFYLLMIVVSAVVKMSDVINFLDIAFGLMAIPTILSTILLALVNWAARQYFRKPGIAKPGPRRARSPNPCGTSWSEVRAVAGRGGEFHLFRIPAQVLPERPHCRRSQKDGLGQRTGVGKAVAGLPVLHDSVQPAMEMVQVFHSLVGQALEFFFRIQFG